MPDDPKHDVPDRAPDGQARRQRPESLPCSYCGRLASGRLNILEALALHGYGKSDCLFCNLTDLRR